MSDRFHIYRDRRDGVPPHIWVAIALSLLVHVAAMWRLPQVRLSTPELSERLDPAGALAVYLVPAPSPPRPTPSPVPRAKPPVALPAPPPKTAPRPPSAPPLIAREQPAPATPSAPPSAPSIAAPAPALPPADSDLSSYIEAQRRARGEATPPAPPSTASKAPPVEDENERAKRVVAANLAPQQTMTFGYDPTQRGGVFHIEHMSDDAAEFMFYGWHKTMRRNMAQLIEVRKGGNPDIRIAVIRKMIAIIRDYEQEEFVWESHRLRRNVTLSARARDNAGLEDFLMTEFFGDRRSPQ